MAILIILAETSLVILVFFLVNLLLCKAFKQLTKIPLFTNGIGDAKTLRRNIQGVLLLCSLLICASIVGVNSFLLYKGENLQEYTLLLISRIPLRFWLNLGIASLQTLVVVILVALFTRLVDHLLNIACVSAKNWEQSTADDQSIDAFFSSFNRIVNTGSWLLTLIWSTQFFQVSQTATEYLFILLRIYLIITLGSLIFKVVAVIIDSLDILSLKHKSPSNLLRFYDRLRNLVPFFKRCLEAVIYVSMATLVVDQIDLTANLAPWGTKIIKLIAIIFISHVFVELGYLAIEEFLLNNPKMSELQKQRRLTIIPLLQSFTKYTIYFGAGIFILQVFTIDPTPILAAAGFVGLAASLGAQNLINDIVSGFFILFENYYLVGDYIAAGNVEEREIEGFVEAIELRTTRVRHPNGQLQIIRNGEMGSIVNYSKKYIYAMVKVRLTYDVELERVYSIVELIGQQLKADYPDVLEPTQVDGIEDFGEYYLLLGTRTKVKPGKNLQIERLFRKMLMDAFNREGIQIPIRSQE